MEATFFDRCLKEYHTKNEEKLEQIDPQVKITNEMLEVLENYIKSSWRRRPLKGTKAGLYRLRSDKELKKRNKEAERQKRERNKIEITTKICKKRNYEESFPERLHSTPRHTKEKRTKMASKGPFGSSVVQEDKSK